jgi:hypothetical protein
MSGTRSTHGEDETYIKNVGQKLEKKRQHWKHMRKWEDNIKIDLKVRWCKVVGWIQLPQYTVQWRALVNIINFWFNTRCEISCPAERLPTSKND